MFVVLCVNIPLAYPVVKMSIAELRKGIRRREFKKVVTQEREQESHRHCAICFDETELSAHVELPCSHSFCHDCIEQWITRRNTCPYCRQRVVPGFKDVDLKYYNLLAFFLSLLTLCHFHFVRIEYCYRHSNGTELNTNLSAKKTSFLWFFKLI
jgi:hypothetical protein